MNKIFCVECGSKIEYSLKKPKFCQECGTPTGATSKASVEIEEENPEVEFDIEKLRGGISLEGNLGSTMTLGEIIGTREGKAPVNLNRPQPFKDGDVLDKTLKDCAANQPSKDVNES